MTTTALVYWRHFICLHTVTAAWYHYSVTTFSSCVEKEVIISYKNDIQAHMRHFARFGTICTILKTSKHLWRSVTFRFVKVTILHGILSQSSYVMLCKITYHLYNLKTWIFKLYKWYVIVQSITYEYATVLVWLSC